MARVACVCNRRERRALAQYRCALVSDYQADLVLAATPCGADNGKSLTSHGCWARFVSFTQLQLSLIFCASILAVIFRVTHMSLGRFQSHNRDRESLYRSVEHRQGSAHFLQLWHGETNLARIARDVCGMWVGVSTCFGPGAVCLFRSTAGTSLT